MEDDLSSVIIKATQVSLGKYIKKPPLSEKLLRKPPFRFLHDIITTVLKTTGFFEGLFEENELISENIKDRESKILFLNKVISILSSTTGKSLSVKPSKIVAGQEPEKTNELLQCLAQALDNNLSSKEAIEAYKENAKSPKVKEQKQANTTKKLIKKTNVPNTVDSKIKEKVTTRDKGANDKRIRAKDKEQNDTKIKKREISVGKNESQSKNITQNKTELNKNKVENKSKAFNQSQLSVNTVTPRNTNHEEMEHTQVHLEISQQQKTELISFTEHNNEIIDTRLESNFITLPLDEELIQTENAHRNSNDLTVNATDQDQDSKKVELSITKEKDNDAVHLEDDSEKLTQQYTPTNSYNNKSNHEIDDEKNNFNRSKGKIAESSPKQTSNKNIDKPLKIRPSSSRPGAPRPREKYENYVPDNETIISGKVNIIAEHNQNEEEEDSSIIIVEENTFSATPDVKDQTDVASEHVHGHLVQQILNSKNELNQVTAKTEIEWQFGVQRAKDAQSQEADLLRYNIQGLSRIANPLGKLLDHIQEDVEVMRQELQQWTTIYEEVSEEMLKQKTLNEGMLLPLQSKLKQLEEEVQEKHTKINDLKILTNKNYLRIEKLLVVPTYSNVI